MTISPAPAPAPAPAVAPLAAGLTRRRRASRLGDAETSDDSLATMVITPLTLSATSKSCDAALAVIETSCEHGAYTRPRRCSGLLDLNGGVRDRVFAREHDDAAHEDEDQEEHEPDEVENQPERGDDAAEAEAL
jgi:hypothetical protein